MCSASLCRNYCAIMEQGGTSQQLPSVILTSCSVYIYSKNVLERQHYRQHRPCGLLEICTGMPDCCSVLHIAKCEQFLGREKANHYYIFTALFNLRKLITNIV